MILESFRIYMVMLPNSPKVLPLAAVVVTHVCRSALERQVHFVLRVEYSARVKPVKRRAMFSIPITYEC